MTEFEDKTLKRLFEEVVETCFYDKDVSFIKEIIWVFRRRTSVYYRSGGIMGIKKRKMNGKDVQIDCLSSYLYARDMIHEIMHEIYYPLENGDLYLLLESCHTKLLSTVRQISKENDSLSSLVEIAKKLRKQIAELEKLIPKEPKLEDYLIKFRLDYKNRY